MDEVKVHGIRQSIGRVPIDDIVDAVIEFINRYNNERPKESLGGLSPVEFRLQNPKGTYPVVIR